MRTTLAPGLRILIATMLGSALVGCGSSDTGGPQLPPPDTSPPVVTEATATRLDRVEVVYNEPVDKASAENVSNYVVVKILASPVPPGVSGDGRSKMPNASAPGDSIGVLAAVRPSCGNKVVLTTEPMEASVPYELHVRGVKDVKGNAIQGLTKPLVEDIRSGKIFTIAGTGFPALGGEDIDPLMSDLYLPQDATIGPDGLPYIVDWNNHRIRVIECDRIRTIIGTGLLGDADPGLGTEVGLNHPTNVCFDADGSLYMAAWHNSKIMKYDPQTKYLDVYANKDGLRTWAGDGGLAYDAVVNLPSSVAIGPDGNVYISDQANFCVRMIDTQTTVITTVVAESQCTGGTTSPCPPSPCGPGFCGDGGPANEACLAAPCGQAAAPASRLEFGDDGRLYLADTSNHRIRVIDTSWMIDTMAGNGLKGFSGDGGDARAAQLNFPTDVAIGSDGSVYIADRDNHCVRMVAGGIISTVAGTGGVSGYAGDGGMATDALLKEPYGICLDAEGNLYIADTLNHRIRVVYR